MRIAFVVAIVCFSLGPETVVNEVRRGYPGDENERRSLALLRLDTKTLEATRFISSESSCSSSSII